MYSGEYDACNVTLSVYPHQASLKNMPEPTTFGIPAQMLQSIMGWYSKGRRFDCHRGQAYFSSLPGVDIHSE
jgi:hypothetical protein